MDLKSFVQNSELPETDVKYIALYQVVKDSLDNSIVIKYAPELYDELFNRYMDLAVFISRLGFLNESVVLKMIEICNDVSSSRKYKESKVRPSSGSWEPR